MNRALPKDELSLSGEVVAIGEGGLREFQAVPKARKAVCIFEYIYFARPDSNLLRTNVYATRKDLGRVMKAVMADHRGRVDGKLVQRFAAELLE